MSFYCKPNMDTQKPTIWFFPLMAHGHMIPILDMAKLFANKGANTTIITTPSNAHFFSKSIQSSNTNVQIKTLKFPSLEVGLPEGCENMDSITKDYKVENLFKFLRATRMLQLQLEVLLEEYKPDCLVADITFPWATESANKFGVPRIVFHGVSFFSLCASYCLKVHQPYKNLSSDSETFVVPELPGEIQLTGNQIPGFLKTEQTEENEMLRFIREAEESVAKSYGVLVNSFYELEPAYADYYRNVIGRKAWHVGPVSLCNRQVEEKGARGKESAINEHECLQWLDSKNPESVIYICFGSVANFSDSQLMEIAIGLEASGRDFIWAVRKEEKKNENDKENWLPDGFEERIKGKGLIIRGWAPQVMILDHESVGGFVTHCGWNSTLEGISAGIPLVTWPIGAEQFYNEKLVTQVLKIGVSVGVEKWVMVSGDFVPSEKVRKAVEEIMVGDEAEARRDRVKVLKEKAKIAVEEGGSSYSDINVLIEELNSRRREN